MSNPVTVRNILDQTNGKFFTISFTKKDGTKRIINARLGVRKGVNGQGLKFNPKEKDLAVIYDMVDNTHKCIGLDSVDKIVFNGKVIVF